MFFTGVPTCQQVDRRGLFKSIGASGLESSDQEKPLFLLYLLFFMCQTGMLVSVSQVHKFTDVKSVRQTTRLDSARTSVHSQVMYVSPLVDSGLCPRGGQARGSKWNVLSTCMCVCMRVFVCSG